MKYENDEKILARMDSPDPLKLEDPAPTNRVTHTPGPWTMVGREILGQAFDGSAHCICDKVRGGSPQSAEANARLIAAAPDLLAALRLLQRGAKEYPCFCGVAINRATEHTRGCAMAQAAIAKAEGRS